MAVATQNTQQKPAPPPESGAVLWISLLFVGLGVAVLGFLFAWIFGAEDFAQAREGGDAGRITLIFLRDFGLIRPILLFVVGVYVARLGLRLYQRDLTTALWARQLLMWLGIASILGFFVSLANSGQVAGGILVAIIPWIFVGSVIYFTMNWLKNNQHMFVGQETLSSKDQRTAWNLLVPTLAVLIFVALQPLEQTFIVSLTNDEFAREVDVEFVGFQNYTELLGLRVDTIPCEREAGSCAVDAEGNTLFPNPRRYLIDNVDSYRDWGYRPLNELNIFGTLYVISARDTDFIDSIWNTMVFTVVAVTFELIIGLFIAMVVNSKFTGRGLMRTAMLLPWAVPTVVSARLWELMLRDNQSGIINRVLVDTGIVETSQAWLTSTELQIPSMIMVDVWKTTPFMALLLLAGLQVIPKDIYEAADVDGASKVRQFFNITLPLLRPTIAVALVFRTLDSIRVFDVFQVLLGSRKFSMATYNYEILVTNNDFGYASAIGVVIFLIILIFTVLYVRILGVEQQ